MRNIDINDLSNLSISEFWTKVSKIKYADGTLMFPNLTKFVLDIMCLPHSSATVE